MAWSTRQLADLAGTTLKAVRHYHRIELLEEPERAGNGYKQYRTEHLVRVLQIRRLRDMGLSLQQIAAMGPTQDDPDAAIDAVDADLVTRIEHLQRAREELALARRHRAPIDLPRDFGPISHHLTEADRALIMVYSRLFTPGTMGTIRDMATVREATDLEFDDLPADADRRTVEGLAARMVPGVQALQVQHPWIGEPVSRSAPSSPAAADVVRQALADLYNPAQLQVLQHLFHLLVDSTDEDPDAITTPERRSAP